MHSAKKFGLDRGVQIERNSHAERAEKADCGSVWGGHWKLDRGTSGRQGDSLGGQRTIEVDRGQLGWTGDSWGGQRTVGVDRGQCGYTVDSWGGQGTVWVHSGQLG
jgi:hypothetical protein